jgi:hypothetical protein
MILPLRAFASFSSQHHLLRLFRTLQPSHSFLTELRTFIPLVCWKATRLFVGDATGLTSDICDILEMSEVDEEVLKAVREHTDRGLRAKGAARSSERVACANMIVACCCTDVVVLCDESLFDTRMPVEVEMSTCRRFGGLARLELPMIRRKCPPLSAINMLLSLSKSVRPGVDKYFFCNKVRILKDLLRLVVDWSAFSVKACR